MTVSEHVYQAVLVGTPDQPLSVLTGNITLDAGRSPHVTASLVIASPGDWETVDIDGTLLPNWVPNVALIEALDPRESRRVRITATRDGIARSFDLGIRDTEVTDEAGDLTLTLSSDEAILEDFAALEDDTVPRTHESSLRDVIDYVLGEAIPGAVLEADPASDADVTAYWSVSNLLFDSSFEETVTTVWANGTNATGFARQTTHKYTGAYAGHWQTAAAGISYASMNGPISVRAGDSYVFDGYVRASVANPFRLLIRFEDASGRVIRDDLQAASAAIGGTWTRLVHIAVAPPGTSQVTLHVGYQASAAGQFPYIDALMFHEGTEAVPYFNGATTDDAHYTYEFSGDVHNSVATRTPVIERAPESLTWRAGQTAMDFLHPLIQAAGFRLVCDEQRRWTLRDEDYRAPGSLAIRYGVNMTAGSHRISRDDGLWYDARVTIYTDPITQARTVDSYALVDPPTRVSTLEVSAPYPGPGRSEYAVRRAQGRGREITASAVSDWAAHAEQRLQITLPDQPIQTGTVQRLTYDLDTDEMTVTARTTDTPALAWALGPDDLTWTDTTATVAWADVDDWSDL